MSVELITIKSNCVVWKNIQLPHPDKSSQSPVFSFKGLNWQFEVNCIWQTYSKSELFYIKVVQPSTYSNSYSIIPYIESMGKYIHTSSMEFCRDILINSYKISSDTITMLFVFFTKSMSTPLDLAPAEVAERNNSDQTSVQTLCLEGLSEDIMQLFNDDAYSDVTLKCGNKSFKAHRNILVARSEVFSAMFKQDMSERNTGIVNIEDMDPNIVEHFLRYLYSSSVEGMSMDIALELYSVADKYAVSTLRMLCSSYILDNLTDDIVCKVLVIADEAEDMEFFDSIASFAAKNCGLLKSAEWKEFAEKFSKVAVKVYFKCFN